MPSVIGNIKEGRTLEQKRAMVAKMTEVLCETMDVTPPSVRIIINEMKNVALFNKIKSADPEVLPAWKALRMATIEGARAISLGDSIGSLEEGKSADFIAIDLRKPTMLPVYTKPMRNIVPNFVYSARGDEVILSVVDGKVIYRNGKILSLDEEAIFDEVQGFTDDIGEKASDEFWKIHGTNAVFMEENKL